MATRHAVYLERLKAQEVKDFLPVIDQVQGAITEVLSGLRVDKVNQLTQAKLRKTLVQLESTQTKLLGQATEAFLKRAERIADYEATFQARAIMEVAPRGVQLRFPAKGDAMTRVLQKPMAVNGNLLNDFMEDWQQSEVKQVSGLVRKAWAQGNTVDELTRAIRGTKAKNFKDGATAISRRHAEVVARTSIAHVANVAREETWASNDDIVTGYKWVSTLDSRTSPQCQSLDGQVFKVGEGPTPPIHIGCRSTTVAELDKKYDWLDEGATRSTENGPVKAGQTYYEWLKDQPEDFQDRVLGLGKGALFRSEGMTAEKFQSLSLNKSFEPLTLQQMKVEEAKSLKQAIEGDRPIALKLSVSESQLASGIRSTEGFDRLTIREAPSPDGRFISMSNVGVTVSKEQVYPWNTRVFEDGTKHTTVVNFDKEVWVTDQALVERENVLSILRGYDPAKVKPIMAIKRSDGSFVIQNGHHTLFSLRAMGIDTIPVTYVDDASAGAKAVVAKALPKVDIAPKVSVKYLPESELGPAEFDVRRYRQAVKAGDKVDMKHFAARLKDDGLKITADDKVVQVGPRLWDGLPKVGSDTPAVPSFAQRQETWLKNLSSEQKKAARWWSGSVQNVAKVREAEAGSGATPEAKAFLDAIKDAPAYEGTVFRGQQMDNWRSLKVGKTFSFKTIVSTSKSLDVGAEFSSYAYQHPVLFRIHTKNGTDISRLVAPEYLEQQEVLLRASAKFRVTRVATSSTEYGDFPLISLEEM